MAALDETVRNPTEWNPPAIVIGEREKALERFFFDCVWVGKVHANGQGPGSPKMTAKGGGTCRWLMDGLWLEGNFQQDQFVGEKYALTWQLHLVVGWDRRAGEYRAVLVDSNGTSALLHGEIDSHTLVMTPVNDLMPSGQSMQLRFVWNAKNRDTVLWRTERSTDGVKWQAIEDYVIRPLPFDGAPDG